jgi:thymidylate kinase
MLRLPELNRPFTNAKAPGTKATNCLNLDTRWYDFNDRILNSGMTMREESGAMAPLIAIIGSDGSGKSTVADHILEWVGRYGPAGRAHLGKQSGNVGRAIGQMPLVGAAMDRLIRRKADDVNDRLKEDKQPTLLPALVISAFTLRRKRRFKRMLAMRKQGLIVITDRYPQVAVPGAYDGPGFPDSQGGSRLVLGLARREQAMFQWMASYRPDLVLRLNVDVDTAFARKPDHRRDALARKIAVTPHLTYGGAPIVDIDANQPLERVFKDAEAAVARVMAERGYVLHEAEPVVAFR